MSSSDPLLALARAARILEESGDPDLAAVADGFEAFLTGRADSLDKALRLTRRQRGSRSWATERAIRERDRLVREAADRFYSTVRPAAQAQALAVELKRFAATAWVRERELEVCPPRHLDTVREYCWRVLHCWDRVIGEEAIRKILVTS